jgi:hypothetical protein
MFLLGPGTHTPGPIFFLRADDGQFGKERRLEYTEQKPVQPHRTSAMVMATACPRIAASGCLFDNDCLEAEIFFYLSEGDSHQENCTVFSDGSSALADA